MVRLSDIVDTQDRSKKKRPSSKESAPSDKLLMSESEITKKKDAESIPNLASAGNNTEKLRSHYEALLEKSKDVRDRVRTDQGISASPVLSILHEIINNDLIDQIYEYAMTIPWDEELPSHIVSVTLGSLKIGKGLGYDTKQLLKLGLGAFLENVGMYKIPDQILQKEGTLSPDEIATIRKHPEISARILGQLGEGLQWLAEMALQIHERSDGSGYPEGLQAEEILEFASIIGLIDTYMAMITNRPHRHKQLQAEAVKTIIGIVKGKFPRRIAKEFLNQISLFPINTYVRLNNKSIGLVRSTDKRQPLRPTIELLYDGLGHKLEERKVIRLSDSPLLHIIDTIDEKALS